jgi:NDP-sugar pyrophosphorylase family protein
MPPIPRALVLCAGAGTRLRSITGPVPKVLVPVAGIPTLDRILSWLADSGVTEIALNLHHHAETLRAHLAANPHPTLTLHTSFEPTLLGTAGACKPLAPFLDRTFLVVYGDVLTDLPLADLLAFHHDRGALLTLAVYHVPNPTECGVVELDPDGRITRFVEKPSPDAVFSDLANAGILVADPALLAHIPPQGPSDFGHDILPALLAAGAPVYGWPIPPHSTVIDMGTPNGLARAEAWLTPSTNPS